MSGEICRGQIKKRLFANEFLHFVAESQLLEVICVSFNQFIEANSIETGIHVE